MPNLILGFLTGGDAFSATGGDEIKTIGSTRYHIFTSSGTFATSGLSKNCQILVVGGVS